ncbi:MAG: ribulose-phosphate 3-epimerase [Acidobacteria bacterium]|jgi:ribulose-phosphate 3-epimerase|nr:ribulose-phosphate 3-epimerase [Acidobacteriota bacterium]
MTLKKTHHPVFPSVLTTNFFDLQEKLTAFEANNIDFIHLDVMDGHFVDNISFGPSAARAIKSKFNFNIDAHLMVSNPGKMIPQFIEAGSDWISFHLEIDEDINENISLITGTKRKPGLVLNPDTNIEKVFPFLEDIHYVLIMSVFPGKGGQKFIPATIERVAQLKNMIKKRGLNCLIQVDGGINTSNIADLVKAGADLFVIGTFLYNSTNSAETLLEIQNKINGAKND